MPVPPSPTVCHSVVSSRIDSPERSRGQRTRNCTSGTGIDQDVEQAYKVFVSDTAVCGCLHIGIRTKNELEGGDRGLVSHLDYLGYEKMVVDEGKRRSAVRSAEARREGEGLARLH